MENDRLQIERKLWADGFKRVMGLDEVGRGCLAGPVVAAGVILKPNEDIDGIRDSKALGESDRRILAEEIKAKSEFWTIKECSPIEIDEINILWASIKAMVKCTEEAKAYPDYLLVDGNKFTSSLIPYTCVVKGDDKSKSIGAASILAKVYRDDLMQKLHEQFPFYGWDSNVGYPTKVHFSGLEEYGYTQHHRMSFSLRTDKAYRET